MSRRAPKVLNVPLELVTTPTEQIERARARDAADLDLDVALETAVKCSWGETYTPVVRRKRGDEYGPWLTLRRHRDGAHVDGWHLKSLVGSGCASRDKIYLDAGLGHVIRKGMGHAIYLALVAAGPVTVDADDID